MKGLILVDVPEHGLRCGEYVDLSDDLGEQLANDGRFDTLAPDPANPAASVQTTPEDSQSQLDAQVDGSGQQADLLGGDDSALKGADGGQKE